jgi:hypothetical protein
VNEWFGQPGDGGFSSLHRVHPLTRSPNHVLLAFLKILKKREKEKCLVKISSMHPINTGFEYKSCSCQESNPSPIILKNKNNNNNNKLTSIWVLVREIWRLKSSQPAFTDEYFPSELFSSFTHTSSRWLNSAIVSTTKTMPNIVITQKQQQEKLKTKWNFWPSGQRDALAC